MPSVHFLCSSCERRVSRESGERPRPCERCQTFSDVVAPSPHEVVARCAACGHAELYFQKDFNRKTGIGLVILGSIFVPWTYGLSLLAVTVLDYVVWRMVKDVIVCYSCQAVHRGYPANPDLKPFDLATHDRHVYGAAPPGAEE